MMRLAEETGLSPKIFDPSYQNEFAACKPAVDYGRINISDTEEVAMQTKQKTERKTEPYGPNIVRAWFDTVFSYAFSGLANERRFLERRNYTFRYQTRTLEYLRPLVEHLPVAARENSEQFVSFFGEVGEAISKHDRYHQELELQCGAFCNALISSDSFCGRYESVAAEAREAMGQEFRGSVFGYRPPADSMGVITEYLVNNIESLPDHYSTSAFWNRYRERFLPLLEEPGLRSARGETAQAGERMLLSVSQLTDLLSQTRSKLSLRFDVPYVAELQNVR